MCCDDDDRESGSTGLYTSRLPVIDAASAIDPSELSDECEMRCVGSDGVWARLSGGLSGGVIGWFCRVR